MNDINIGQLVNSFVKDLKSYSSARDEFSSQDKQYIFMDANENPFASQFNRYPDPHHHQLRDKIAQLKGISKNQLLLGNGSDEVIDLLIRTFCKPGGDDIISITPTYGMYEVVADINQIKITKVALTDDFQPDFAQILSSVSETTKIIFLCSPNNPTGNSLEPARILDILDQFNGLVVLDEAYVDFSIQPSMVNLLAEHKNLVIMQTFSKAYGLAGLRLGMLIAHADIVKYITKLKPPYNVNRFTQDKALEVLDDLKSVNEQIDIIYKEKLKLESELPNINWIDKCYPSDANFILIKVDDAKQRYQQLLDKKIVVRDRSNLPKCDNCLRISVGTPEENQYLLSTLKKLDHT